MKRLLKRLHTAQTRGQSMVEMAIIAPILIFFLIGIFEVGWALRNYLVMVNVNREITRFAVRPGYMDFSNEVARNDSYEQVKRWTETSISDQLDLDFDTKTTLIISHLVVDTGQPCEDMSTCQCEWFDPNSALYDPSQAFTKDDIIIHPGMNNYEYQSFTFGITDTVTGPRASRLPYDDLTTKLADQNNKFNCEIMKKGGIASANNVVATELFHDQSQLFGFPVISNPFTDPLPLYTHTVMRLIGGARASGGVEGSLISTIDTIGEVCFAYPFLVSKAQLDAPGVDPGDSIDILDGDPSEGEGWALWLGTEDEEFLKYQLQYPQMSVNSYLQPNESPPDTVLNPGDKVASLSGFHLDDPDVRGLVEGLAGREIVVPVWHTFDGNNYITERFIRASIQSVTVSPPTVTATYLGDDVPLACQPPPAS